MKRARLAAEAKRNSAPLYVVVKASEPSSGLAASAALESAVSAEEDMVATMTAFNNGWIPRFSEAHADATNVVQKPGPKRCLRCRSDGGAL